MAASSRLMITEAERRFPVRVRIPSWRWSLLRKLTLLAVSDLRAIDNGPAISAQDLWRPDRMQDHVKAEWAIINGAREIGNLRNPGRAA